MEEAVDERLHLHVPVSGVTHVHSSVVDIQSLSHVLLYVYLPPRSVHSISASVAASQPDTGIVNAPFRHDFPLQPDNLCSSTSAPVARLLRKLCGAIPPGRLQPRFDEMIRGSPIGSPSTVDVHVTLSLPHKPRTRHKFLGNCENLSRGCCQSAHNSDTVSDSCPGGLPSHEHFVTSDHGATSNWIPNASDCKHCVCGNRLNFG
jgi:hypothetical protein